MATIFTSTTAAWGSSLSTEKTLPDLHRLGWTAFEGTCTSGGEAVKLKSAEMENPLSPRKERERWTVLNWKYRTITNLRQWKSAYVSIRWHALCILDYLFFQRKEKNAKFNWLAPIWSQKKKEKGQRVNQLGHHLIISNPLVHLLWNKMRVHYYLNRSFFT